MKKEEKIDELETSARQTIKEIQNMINPKWNVAHHGIVDGPLDLLLMQIKSLYDMSETRYRLFKDDINNEETEKYKKQYKTFKHDYKHFLQDILFFKVFLTNPFGRINIESYVSGISGDANRLKNFFAIIRNILIREDALALNFDFIEQVYRIHQMANIRGKKTRGRKEKKSQKGDKK